MMHGDGVYFAKDMSNGIYKDFNYFSMIFIEEMCIVALEHVVMTNSGSTFYPLLVILSISG